MPETRLLTEARSLRRAGYRCVYIGDSLIHQAHSFSYSGGPGTTTGTLQSGSLVTATFLAWLETFSYGAIRCPVWADPTEYVAGWRESGTSLRGFWGPNFGINGSLSSQILARLDGSISPCIMDFAFDIAFLEGGTNDIAAAVDPEVTIANMIACMDVLLARGKTVFFLPIRARGVSSWASGGASRKKARYINQRLKAAVLARSNIYYLNWDRAWANSQTSDGEPFTGFSNDAVHDAPIGGFAIAKYLWHGLIGSNQVWAGLKSFFPQQDPLYTVQEDVYDATNNPYGNLHPNGMMIGTGGVATGANGASGDVANSMTLERSAASGSTTVAGTKETPSDNSGFRQVMTFTPGGVASETFYLRGTTTTVSVPAGMQNAGKWIEATLDVEVTAAYDKLSSVELYVNEVQPNITYRGMAAFSGAFLPAETWQGRIHCPLFRLHPTTTQLRPRVQMIMTGGGTGAPVIKVGRFNVRQVDDPRPAFGWDGPTYGEA